MSMQASGNKRFRESRSFRLLNRWTAPVGVLLLVIVVWDLVVRIGEIHPIIFPGPQAVAEAAWKLRSDLLTAVGRTSLAAATGLAISIVAGTSLAFLFSQSAMIRRALFPYAVLLQTVPIIAIAPIVIVSFGRGFFSVALVSSVISLFPIVTNTTTGLLQIDPNLLDLFRLNSASRWQTLWKLRLPSSLPFLLAGIRIACGSAIVGAIVGEFFVGSGQPGLGAMIQRKSASLDLADLYATVLTSTLLGTLAFGAVALLGDVILQRWFGQSELERSDG
jgi:NitT/TauT family transport system permease protein